MQIGRSHAEGSSGFTLIEVVVALAIAALGLGAMMSATGIGQKSVILADRYIEATRRAQSKLAAYNAATDIAPGEKSGEDGDGFFWRIKTVPAGTHAQPATAPGAQPPAPVTLYDIAVTISWQVDRSVKSVTLQSERLAHQASDHG